VKPVGTGDRRNLMSRESAERSFWDRLFNVAEYSGREERVIEYILHRLEDGAPLADILQEEYVRRNASPEEVDEICARPELVHAAREHMALDFSSGDLDPGRRGR
jgi:hypothetical protein